MGGRRAHQSIYDWLKQSCDPRAARGRFYLEMLYEEFPDKTGEVARELRTRGPDADNHFYGALATLIMYDRFVKAGHRVVPDAALPGSRKKYDLAVTAAKGTTVAVEVTTLCEKGAWTASRHLQDQAAEALSRRLSSNCYRVSLWALDAWTSSPPVSRVREQLAAKLRELETEVSRAPVRIDCPYAGCPFFLSVTSRDPRDDGPTVRVGSRAFADSNTASRICDKVLSKLPRKYNIGDTPYVLALANGLGFPAHGDLLRALYGHWSVRQINETMALEREFGLFTRGCPRRSDVEQIAGLLFLPRFLTDTYDPDDLTVTFYENPYATHGADPSLLAADVALMSCQTADGMMLREMAAPTGRACPATKSG